MGGGEATFGRCPKVSGFLSGCLPLVIQPDLQPKCLVEGGKPDPGGSRGGDVPGLESQQLPLPDGPPQVLVTAPVPAQQVHLLPGSSGRLGQPGGPTV